MQRPIASGSKVSPMAQEALVSSRIFQSAHREQRFLSRDSGAIKVIERCLHAPKNDRRRVWNATLGTVRDSLKRQDADEDDDELYQQGNTILDASLPASSAQKPFETPEDELRPLEPEETDIPHSHEGSVPEANVPSSFADFVSGANALTTSTASSLDPSPSLQTAYTGGASAFRDFLRPHPVRARSAPVPFTHDEPLDPSVTDPQFQADLGALTSEKGAGRVSYFLVERSNHYTPAQFDAITTTCSENLLPMLQLGKRGLLMKTLVEMGNPEQANKLAGATIGHVAEIAVLEPGQVLLRTINIRADISPCLKEQILREMAASLLMIAKTQFGSLCLQDWIRDADAVPTILWDGLVPQLDEFATDQYAHHVVKSCLQFDPSLVSQVLPIAAPWWTHAWGKGVIYQLLFISQPQVTDGILAHLREHLEDILFDQHGQWLLRRLFKETAEIKNRKLLADFAHLVLGWHDLLEQAIASTTGRKPIVEFLGAVSRVFEPPAPTFVQILTTRIHNKMRLIPGAGQLAHVYAALDRLPSSVAPPPASFDHRPVGGRAPPRSANFVPLGGGYGAGRSNDRWNGQGSRWA